MSEIYSGILGLYSCGGCNRTHTFSERYYEIKKRSFICNHFNLEFSMARSNQRTKMSVKITCNICHKEYKSELKAGSKNNSNKVIIDDNYKITCCGNVFEVIVSVSEEYFDQNESSDIHYDINPNNNNQNRNNNQNNFNNNQNSININNNQNNINRNNIINNNNNNQMNPMSLMMSNMMANMSQINMNIQMNNINNMNYMNKFDVCNILPLSQKNKAVNFIEEKTNKNYRLYTSPKLRLGTVLNDLLNLYPEINYFNNFLALNNQNMLNLNYTVENLNLNDNSFIVIKNKIN